MLSYSYVIIMNYVTNAPGHRNNVVDWLNTMDEHFLKGKMELIGKLASNNATNIGMLSNLSKMSPLNLHINVYIFSIKKKYWMGSKVAKKNGKRQ